jgi:hypothetical protein
MEFMITHKICGSALEKMEVAMKADFIHLSI